jgi:hypothetical protein
MAVASGMTPRGAAFRHGFPRDQAHHQTINQSSDAQSFNHRAIHPAPRSRKTRNQPHAASLSI